MDKNCPHAHVPTPVEDFQSCIPLGLCRYDMVYLKCHYNTNLYGCCSSVKTYIVKLLYFCWLELWQLTWLEALSQVLLKQQNSVLIIKDLY